MLMFMTIDVKNVRDSVMFADFESYEKFKHSIEHMYNDGGDFNF